MTVVADTEIYFPRLVESKLQPPPDPQAEPDLATQCVINRFKVMVEEPCQVPFPRGEKIALQSLIDQTPSLVGIKRCYNQPRGYVATSNKVYGFAGYHEKTLDGAILAQLIGSRLRAERFHPANITL